MERIRHGSTGPRSRPLVTLATALAVVLATAPAHAQFGSPVTYTFRVVDQAGRPLDGSMVRIEGAMGNLVTPASVELAAGPQLVTIEPAAQGAMLPGGALCPEGANGLSRNEFLFLDPMGGDVVIEWRTADVTVALTDPSGAAIPGARWGFAGDGAAWAPGTITLPVTDEALYPTLLGPSTDGWKFDVRAAFDGNPVDLVRGEQREVSEATTALAFTWQQTSCTMGVVDGAGNAIRGATWTVLGHTFEAGDAITWPATDEVLYPDLAGALATGFPVTLATNTAAGSGPATFEVTAAGALAPDFVDVNGASFGLRCGVNAFPPITTGILAARVLADGAPFAGARLSLVDANGVASNGVTGVDGGVLWADVPQGAARLTLAIPAGYHAVDPASGVLLPVVVAGQTTEARFAIAQDVAPPPPPPPPLANSPETWNYWRREVTSAMRGHGRHDETFANMSSGYPQAIFAGFAQHPTAPVRVEGVTQVDPDGDGPTPARRLELADMDRTLDPGNGNAQAAAKRELLVVLLNVVSGRLSLELVVDAAGTTLDQEIRRLAAMINDGSAANDAVARNAAQRINAGRAGWGSATYAYNGGGAGLVYGDSDPDAVLDGGADAVALTATRVSAAGGGVRVAFTLARGQRVTLDVYDATGRRQARLYEGDAPAGTTAVTWSAAAARPGVYFARLVAEAGSKSAKLIASR